MSAVSARLLAVVGHQRGPPPRGAPATDAAPRRGRAGAHIGPFARSLISAPRAPACARAAYAMIGAQNATKQWGIRISVANETAPTVFSPVTCNVSAEGVCYKSSNAWPYKPLSVLTGDRVKVGLEEAGGLVLPGKTCMLELAHMALTLAHMDAPHM